MRKSLWIAGVVALGLATAGMAGAQATDTDSRMAAAEAAYKAGDYGGAARLWQPLAEQGLAEAQFGIGRAYLRGGGSCREEVPSLEWLTKAANLGHARAQLEVGRAHLYGWGVAENKDEAIVWVTRSAETGLAEAQQFLGYIYSRDKDYAKAIAWWQTAADQGDKYALNALGNMYLDGQGVARDDVKGVSLILSAAEKGLTWELYRLSEMYEQGRGVKADYVQAYKWYVLAYTSGYDKRAGFDANIDRLKARMTAAEVTQAETLIEAARPIFPVRLPPVAPMAAAKPVCRPLLDQ